MYFLIVWKILISQGVGIGYPITTEDASVSSVIEPEEVCSSDSEDENAYDNPPNLFSGTWE